MSWLKMRRDHGKDFTAFSLVDENNDCVLDVWMVGTPGEHTAFMQDLYDLGLITFDQLMSHGSAGD